MGCLACCNGGLQVRNVVLTSSLFCGPFLLVFALNNTVAWIAYKSSQALPVGTIVIILLIWALVTFPLTVRGPLSGPLSLPLDVDKQGLKCLPFVPCPCEPSQGWSLLSARDYSGG